MIKKYIINKITVTTMCVTLLCMFYLIPSANMEIEKENITKNTIENTIYLLDQDDYLSKVTYFYSEQTLEEEIRNKLNNLINGVDTLDMFYPIIPKNTKVNNIKIDKNNIYIDFSKDILNVNEIYEEAMIESIVYTLSEINGIDNIYITVENTELKELPNSKKEINYPLTRGIGINKEYNINSLKDLNQTTIVFSKMNNDYQYYVPITMITNNEEEKINIIIEELKSTIHSQNDLNGYINDNLKLEGYTLNDNTMTLVFNEYIFTNENSNLISEDVKYVISESIFENYDVTEVILDTKNQKNIAKITENP